MVCISRAPASVGATLRVVRDSRRRPRRPSRFRIVWLGADCETPNLAAVLVKLASRATVRKATTKHPATSWNVPLVVALRYIGNLVLLVVVFDPHYGRALVKSRRTGLVLVCAASLALAALFAGLAFQRMPVAETTAIIILAPFGVMILGGVLLGEKIAVPNWMAAAVGFLGILPTVPPGSGLDTLGVVFAVLTAAAATVSYNLLSRVLVRTETTPALMFYAALDGTAAFGAASALAPVKYLHLAWAGLLGWLIFLHVPDALRLLGMVLTAGSGAASALGLGCMGMSQSYGVIPDPKDMIPVLRGAFEQAVTFFDTAEVYGPFTDEYLVGEALEPFKGQVTIATKFGFNLPPETSGPGYVPGKLTVDSRPNTIRRAVEGSLRVSGSKRSTSCISAASIRPSQLKMWRGGGAT